MRSLSAAMAEFASTALAVPPAAVMSDATRWAASSVMSVTTTVAPAAASSFATDSPMPLPPPVTMATLPSNSDMIPSLWTTPVAQNHDTPENQFVRVTNEVG